MVPNSVTGSMYLIRSWFVGLRFCVYWAWVVGAWLVNVRKMGWGQEDPETPSPTVPFPRPKQFQTRVIASLGTVTHSWCLCCFCRLCLQARLLLGLKPLGYLWGTHSFPPAPIPTGSSLSWWGRICVWESLWGQRGALWVNPKCSQIGFCFDPYLCNSISWGRTYSSRFH